MFENLFYFFAEWLFNNSQSAFLSTQGQEFVCIIFSALTLIGVLSLALIPIKKLIAWILGA